MAARGRHPRSGEVETLEQPIIVWPGEDMRDVAQSLLGPKSKATLVKVSWPAGEMWPIAVYSGTKSQLAAVTAAANGSQVGRPRKK